MNNYCRNCGEKLEEGSKICGKCQVVVIDERIRVDNGYIKYIILNLILIILGIIVPFGYKSLFFIAAFLVIQAVGQKYKNNMLVWLLKFWESLIFYGFLIYIVYIMISCSLVCF